MILGIGKRNGYCPTQKSEPMVCLCVCCVCVCVLPSFSGSRVIATLSLPLPRLTRWGVAVWTFSPFPVSIRSRCGDYKHQSDRKGSFHSRLIHHYYILERLRLETKTNKMYPKKEFCTMLKTHLFILIWLINYMKCFCVFAYSHLGFHSRNLIWLWLKHHLRVLQNGWESTPDYHLFMIVLHVLFCFSPFCFQM